MSLPSRPTPAVPSNRGLGCSLALPQGWLPPHFSSSLLKTHLPQEAFPDCPAYILNSPARQPPDPFSPHGFSLSCFCPPLDTLHVSTRHLETVSPTSMGITAPGPRCLESGPTQSGLE